MSTGKKSYIIVVILAKVRTLSLDYPPPKIHTELSKRTHGVTVIGVGSLSF